MDSIRKRKIAEDSWARGGGVEFLYSNKCDIKSNYLSLKLFSCGVGEGSASGGIMWKERYEFIPEYSGFNEPINYSEFLALSMYTCCVYSRKDLLQCNV